MKKELSSKKAADVEGEKNPILIGDYSLFSILAFVLGFVFWPIGFVFGLMALSEIKKYPDKINQGSKYLAWAGILLLPIFIIFTVFLFQSIFTFTVIN